ncbi:DNA internalization-related competence protein ComEC/Rec2, partial [bacterium]|nr:DNA internalization-related competence protein ComEC/Rec2 [bacterium]
MVLVWMGAELFEGEVSFWTRWGFALFLVLLCDPFAPLSVGFWLSFSAVAWLVLSAHRLSQAKRFQWIGTPWIAALGLFPLTIYFFAQSTLISPVANTLAIPWVSFLILPSALLGTLLLPIAPLSHGCIAFANWNLAALETMLQWCAAHPLWTGYFSTPSIPAVILASIGAVWLCAPSGVPGRLWAWACFLPLCCTTVVSVPMQAVRCTILDVGQGLAVVVETARHVLVYDTGPRYGGGHDAGQQILVPFLRYQGRHHVDRLILSHLDMDHIGGAPALLAALPVDWVESGQPYAVGGLCQQGAAWDWDGVHFKFLHPVQPVISKKKNNSSCVLLIEVGSQRILLPGDIEAAVEQQLIRDWGENLRSTVLVVPHHGSRTSSSVAFIDMV